MFGIGAAIRAIAILIIVVVIAAGLWYVMNIKADLAVSEANNQKLEDATRQQTLLIDGMKKDISQIQETNRVLVEQNENQRKDVESLTRKFSKDIGQRAIENPSLVERLVNRGTNNAMRCLELASGAPLNDAEKKAKTPTEANRECPNLIDRNYVTPAD